MVTCSVNLLVDACNQGDIETVREFLNEGRIDSLTEEGESLLSAACSAGCYFLVEMILDMGADIEDRGHKDTTPLMEAANSGHSDIVKLLIERKASINAQTNQGNTPLILAAANGHTECVRLLLEGGARTEEHNESGHTALMEAASNGHVDVAKLLISKGASINTHSHEFKESALTLACYKGQLEMVKFLLEAGADQEHKTEEMHTALMEASMDGHVEVARLLLDSGAQVTMPADSFESPLTLAACGGHVELAMLLLERGANIEEVNDEGYTPLMEAAREGHEEMVALLLSQGADINAQTEETLETALTLACCGGFLEVVDFLIKAGAEISAGANTPLMEASQEGHLELVKYLIVAGADVNAATSSGDTALMYASDNGHSDVAEVLIAAGANIEQEAEGGRTPLMKACRSGHASTVEFLISRGADVNKISTNCDQTPLSLACSHGHLEVVEILLAHGADPTHRLRDSSTMLIEAAKGGHTTIVQLLIDYPASLQSSPVNAALPTNNNNNNNVVSSMPNTTNNTNNSNSGGSNNNSNCVSSSSPNSNNSTTATNTLHNSSSRKAKTVGKSPKSLARHARQNQPNEQTSQASFNQNEKPTPISHLETLPQGQHNIAPSNQQNSSSTTQGSAQHHVPPPATGDSTSTSVLSPASWYPPIEVDSQTDSNHDTALTVACSGGHEDLVQLLLNRGPDVEHRDKKGFTSLMLAATAGHEKIVEILLNHHAELEAQSERTKDTALSLACSSGRYEVVEILLARGANKEHRNVSDYTPLSLAASGGYVSIIKLLLTHGAEINSRTGSKLGISPLMLAAMNGHAQTVKLLLDMGSDINAQIETNRNTALTLACFQGRVDVVSLLLDRKANAEHRAKTGLTPLMEAASGGFVDVGRVLLDKGADVNAPPVPSSRDTALTIAADKGHCKFVELLLSRGAACDVKNKKGNSPLWLACNGGHIDVVNLLIQAGVDVDSQDNRKISCLMAGFRRGHVKVVKLMVRHVTQFPSDQEINRFMALVTEKDLTKKCLQCMEIIHQAKERQAAEANKHASILLQEIDQERSREETRKAAAARRREKKRQKKKEKQEQQRAKNGDSKENIVSNHKKDSMNGKTKQPKSSSINAQMNENHNESSSEDSRSSSDNEEDDSLLDDGESLDLLEIINRDMLLTGNLNNKRPLTTSKQQVPSQQATKVNSQSKIQVKTNQTQCTSRQIQQSAVKKHLANRSSSNLESTQSSKGAKSSAKDSTSSNNLSLSTMNSHNDLEDASSTTRSSESSRLTKSGSVDCEDITSSLRNFMSSNKQSPNYTASDSFSSSSSVKTSSTTVVKPMQASISRPHTSTPTPVPVINNVAGANNNNNSISNNNNCILVDGMNPASNPIVKKPATQKREEGWKEIVRKSKKVMVPAAAISRVIGRGGCNINTVREVSCAHIEVEKQKGQADRGVIIKGTAESTRIAQQLIYALISESNKDLNEVIKKLGLQRPVVNATNNPSKYMSTSSSISSSSSSKSTYTNSTMHANPISSVGVWNNSTATNLATNPTSVRPQPSRSAVRSPAITPNYSVSNSIATTSYLITSAINDRAISTYLQHPLPSQNQASMQQSQIKTPSEASIAAIAQQIAAVGHRQQSQYDPMGVTAETLVPGLTESLLASNSINDTINEQQVNIDSCVINQHAASPNARSPTILGTVTYESGGPTNMKVPTSSSSNHNIQDQQELADFSLAFANVPVSTPEYSPFDNLFSKVAQTSVWHQNVSTSLSEQTSMYQNHETQESLRHLPNLKPIGTERKTIIECMNRMSMMNLPPYNQ